MFDDVTVLAMGILIFLIATLYSSVGHAGASGYLAVMALFGIEPALMKPAALFMNILVASIATHRFWSSGYFSWRLFGTLATFSAPAAFIGGFVTLSPEIYKPLVGLALLYAALRLLKPGKDERVAQLQTSSQPTSLTLAGLGSGIGLLSGLTGVGGGIFLSPVLIFLRMAEVKVVSGVSAAFILVNSVAGLAGHLSKTPSFPSFIYLWAVAAVAGGFAGSWAGSVKFSSAMILRLLGVVLLMAGIKMVCL